MAIKDYKFTKVVNVPRLQSEIQDSPIPIALSSIDFRTPDALTVWFKDALSPEDEVALASLVAGHVPTPLDPESDIMKATDNRLIVKPNSRPLYTHGYFTSVGDNTSVPGDCGGGTDVSFAEYVQGDPAEKAVTHMFNVEGNRSWIFEGFLNWEGCRNDSFTFEIRPRVTPHTVATGTDFYKSNSTGLILPVTGTGNISIDTQNMFPVSSVPKTDTGLLPTPSGYWNATYNKTTHNYDNLTPAPAGDGKYHLFHADVLIKRHINKFCMTGTAQMHFGTSDPSELGSNLRCVYKFTSSDSVHAWRAAISISMFREKVK